MTANLGTCVRRLTVAGLLGCAPLGHASEVAFREPQPQLYHLEGEPSAGRILRPQAAVGSRDWIRATGSRNGGPVEFGRRIVLRFSQPPDGGIPKIPPGLSVTRQVDATTWILEAPDARGAVEAASALSRERGIAIAVPTQRRPSLRRHFPTAPPPDDPLFPLQTSLQTVRPDFPFLPAGFDLRIRPAWAVTRGAGVVVGIADDGIEPAHPDLLPNLSNHGRNFVVGTTDGSPVGSRNFHGTAVAGLVAAVGDNAIGLTGVAPAAGLMSWVIFDADGNMPDDAGMAEMFGDRTGSAAVQNHSWGNSEFFFVSRRFLEDEAITRAVTTGRGGRGIIFVRSAGNTREFDYRFNAGSGDANLDGYANDPRQIAVAAVRQDGRVASYSTPGACVLVAAPSGDLRYGFPGLVTTDRLGAAGENTFPNPGDPTSADYLSGAYQFSGTSASAPLISGCVALILSANPSLGWRDVPEILALSARQTDREDPDLRTNAAGFRVTPNTGFGVPDAGTAVRLAQAWKPHGPPSVARQMQSQFSGIPDGIVGGPAGSTTYSFNIPDTLVVQHAQVALTWDHPRAQDLRLVLTSPGGLSSLLLRPGSAAAPVPPEWTFLSVLHLGEGSRGIWTVEIRDEQPGFSGSVASVELILTGRGIVDSDTDALDDDWERSHLDTLASGAADDPDGDGWNNAAEQLAGTDPARNDIPFHAILSAHPGEALRLSWPATEGASYEIWTAPDASQPFTRAIQAPGAFPEAGWFPPQASSNALFQIRITSMGETVPVPVPEPVLPIAPRPAPSPKGDPPRIHSGRDAGPDGSADFFSPSAGAAVRGE